MAKNKKQDPAVLKLDVDNQCPNCGHFSYKAESNTGCWPYFGMLASSLLIWSFIDWITSSYFTSLMVILAVCTFILMIIFKQKIFPTKKTGEFIEFTCSNCNYKNNLKLL